MKFYLIYCDILCNDMPNDILGFVHVDVVVGRDAEKATFRYFENLNRRLLSRKISLKDPVEKLVEEFKIEEICFGKYFKHRIHKLGKPLAFYY